MTNSELKFSEWEKYADDDLSYAHLGLKEDGAPNLICFHTQQAAEKYLKGYLVLHNNEFEKTHQLSHILDLCRKIDPLFEELKEDIFYLTRFYIETRYPGDIPEFTIEEAKKAYVAAVRVKTFIQKAIRKIH